jgi:hypothetical protein
MHWYLILLALLVTPLPSLSEEYLRVLIACDTASNLGSPTKKDIAHLKAALQEICLSTKLRLSMDVLAEERLSIENIQKWMKTIKKNSSDVVLFYYSGHGGRPYTLKSPWPFLVFMKKGESVSGDSIYQKLKSVGSRLTIIILDCCNNIIALKPSYGLRFTQKQHRKKSFYPGMKPLFLKTQGIMIMTGAAPGEKAFALDDGSVLTNSFLKALREAGSSKDATWEKVWLQTRKICSSKQNPISSLQISSMQE